MWLRLNLALACGALVCGALVRASLDLSESTFCVYAHIKLGVMFRIRAS